MHVQDSHAATQEHHPGASEYFVIAAILGVITAAEVGVYYMQALRPVLVPTLIVLSTVKFALVIMYYMHLKFDHKLFTAFFLAGLFIAGSTILALMALFNAFYVPAPQV